MRNDIDAVALKTLYTHTHEGRLLCDRKEGEGVKLIDGQWDFQLFQPTGTTSTIRVPENSHSAFRFLIDFEPAIQAGTEMSYTYVRHHFNYIPYTREELDTVITDKRMHNRVMAAKRLVGQDFIVTQPTDHLSIVMQFPEKYEIRDWEVLACEYRSDQVNKKETDRVNDFLHHQYDKFEHIHTLRLEVARPRANSSYFLLYAPPSKDDIPDSEEIK